jgi:hypothetical protein
LVADLIIQSAEGFLRWAKKEIVLYEILYTHANLGKF